AFEKADQGLAGVVTTAGSLCIDALECLLGERAVIALELLLGAQLDTVIGQLALAALAVLAGTIGAGVERALGTAPDVFAETTIDFMLLCMTFRHRMSFLKRK